MNWSSNKFYEGKLIADKSVKNHLLKDLKNISKKENDDENLSECSLFLIDTNGYDMKEIYFDDENSHGNEGEVELVNIHINELIENYSLSIDQIGIITLYNLQVQLLRQKLLNKYPNLEIKSVDRFQGREKEIIIISMVRSNLYGEAGFLSDSRRINVAIKRARRHLCIICNVQILTHDPFIKRLIDYMIQHGQIHLAFEFIDGFYYFFYLYLKKRVKHGGWWKVTKFHEINGNVAIEFGTNSYVHSLDNGLFCIGSTRSFGEGPEQQQILTAIRISENKIALKSGFRKYLAINKNGLVIGRSDAIGMREHFEPVFENGNLALSASNDKFIRFNDEGDPVAMDDRATEGNFIQIQLPVEEQGTIRETEINYVKKYQKFQDKKLRINQGDIKNLVDAKKHGSLHEVLLDRREQMKADRYCK
ncbi:unnamed protein product [Rotaria sp. Silwood2]|nr:unnamed protein product [Rotaria sp. Silwood2]